MTSETDMDWLGAEADPKEDALRAAGASARLALFNVVRTAFDRELRAGRATRSRVAKELGVSPQAVSRLLSAPRNMTIETASKLLFVMGSDLKVAERRSTERNPERVGRWMIEPALRTALQTFDSPIHFHFTVSERCIQPSLSSRPSQTTIRPNVKFKTIHGSTFANISNSEGDGFYERIGDCIDNVAIVTQPAGTSDRVLEIA